MSEALLQVPLAAVNTDLSVNESEPISHLDLGDLVTAIATKTEFEKEASIATEVSGLGMAHPPTDHEDFDYWNRVSGCVYLTGAADKTSGVLTVTCSFMNIRTAGTYSE